ncbi:DUF3096 domain-containing protein [Thiohalorhabdus methylotrophus]|uniref:DUF3096 domain-containing protein n=1 Tax=Thiohalorhabdus methylotrophus TaxID=3242694 RepID=A0ABV4TW62_9GAMM
MNIYIQLEPLLALVAGLAALVVPAKLGTRIIGAYLVAIAVLELLNIT